MALVTASLPQRPGPGVGLLLAGQHAEQRNLLLRSFVRDGMSSWIERVPVVGVLLSLLALAAATTATVGPDHLLLALAVTCALTLAVTTDAPLAPRLLSVRRRSESCGLTGVRSADPDGSGHPRPRAPGRDS